jgi:hypothetical protein
VASTMATICDVMLCVCMTSLGRVNKPLTELVGNVCKYMFAIVAVPEGGLQTLRRLLRKVLACALCLLVGSPATACLVHPHDICP